MENREEIRTVFNVIYAELVNASPVRREPDHDAEPSKCHQNARRYCETHPGFVVVTGWLMMPFFGTPLVWFIPHSVVGGPDGQLLDVTPQNDERIILKFLPDTSPLLLKAIASNIGFFDYMPSGNEQYD